MSNYGRILGPMSHPVGNVIYQIRLLKKDSNLVDKAERFLGPMSHPVGNVIYQIRLSKKGPNLSHQNVCPKANDAQETCDHLRTVTVTCPYYAPESNRDAVSIYAEKRSRK